MKKDILIEYNSWAINMMLVAVLKKTNEYLDFHYSSISTTVNSYNCRFDTK